MRKCQIFQPVNPSSRRTTFAKSFRSILGCQKERWIVMLGLNLYAEGASYGDVFGQSLLRDKDSPKPSVAEARFANAITMSTDEAGTPDHALSLAPKTAQCHCGIRRRSRDGSSHGAYRCVSTEFVRAALGSHCSERGSASSSISAVPIRTHSSMSLAALCRLHSQRCRSPRIWQPGQAGCVLSLVLRPVRACRRTL